MKQIIKITLSLFVIIASFTSCVDDKDFDTPQIKCDDNSISEKFIGDATSFANVVNTYTGAVSKFNEVGGDLVYMIGYVSSNDLKGNFYKELFIQDKPENPTYALKLNINLRSLYTKYPVGSKLYIQLNGLAIDVSHGELVIGESINESLEPIREAVSEKLIYRACEKSDMVPLSVNSSSIIDGSYLGKLVQLEGVMFEKALFNNDDVGVPFVNPNNDFDTHRNIVFCEDDSLLSIETSSFAAYSNTPIPNEKFMVTGILSRDYGNDFYVFKMRSLDDLVTNESARCDPPLFCDEDAIGGSTVVYEQDFENIANEAALDALGWTNINVNGGSHRWQVRNYSGNNYMQNGAYNTGESPLESWLVTSAINLDNSTDEALTFDVNVGYHNGNPVTIYASTDFSGDVATATWEQIGNVDLPAGPSSGYGSFASAGNVSLSCLSGEVYIAFKYLGADGGITTTFQIDNVKITGNN